MDTLSSVKPAGHDGNFTYRLNWLFRMFSLWLCLFPAVFLSACQAFYWLKFSRFLDLNTSWMLPGFSHACTSWEGVNILIHKFFELPIFITIPSLCFCLLFVFYESVLGISFLLSDSKKIAAYFSSKYTK